MCSFSDTDIGPTFEHELIVIKRIKYIFLFNPLTPMSDQDRTSPYNINTISCRQVMRINTNINQGIIS